MRLKRLRSKRSRSAYWGLCQDQPRFCGTGGAGEPLKEGLHDRLFDTGGGGALEEVITQPARVSRKKRSQSSAIRVREYFPRTYCRPSPHGAGANRDPARNRLIPAPSHPAGYLSELAIVGMASATTAIRLISGASLLLLLQVVKGSASPV